eukprot:gene15132-biopygen7906
MEFWRAAMVPKIAKNGILSQPTSRRRTRKGKGNLGSFIAKVLRTDIQAPLCGAAPLNIGISGSRRCTRMSTRMSSGAGCVAESGASQRELSRAGSWRLGTYAAGAGARRARGCRCRRGRTMYQASHGKLKRPRGSLGNPGPARTKGAKSAAGGAAAPPPPPPRRRAARSAVRTRSFPLPFPTAHDLRDELHIAHLLDRKKVWNAIRVPRKEVPSADRSSARPIAQPPKGAAPSPSSSCLGVKRAPVLLSPFPRAAAQRLRQETILRNPDAPPRPDCARVCGGGEAAEVRRPARPPSRCSCPA